MATTTTIYTANTNTNFKGNTKTNTNIIKDASIQA